jgi:hypothetical protein
MIGAMAASLLLASVIGAHAASEPSTEDPKLKDAVVLDHNCADAKAMFPPGDPNIETQCDPNDQ